MKDQTDRTPDDASQRLQRVLELGISPGAVTREAMRRIRVLAGVSLGLCIFAGGPWMIQFARAGLPDLSAVLAVTVAAALVNLAVLRRTLSHHRASHCGIAILTGFLTYSIIHTGGFDSPNYAWFFLVPLCAAVAIDMRGALAWTSVALGVTAVLFGLHQAGVVFENPTPVGMRASLLMAGRVLLMLSIGIIGASFVNSQRRAERELSAATAEAVREAAYRELIMHAAVAASEAESLDDAMREGVERICEAMGWAAASVHHVDEHGNASIGGIVRSFDERLRPLRPYIAERLIVPGEGAVARAAASGESVLRPIPLDTVPAGLAAAARATGIDTAFAVPVPVRGRVRAVLEFALRGEPDDPERLAEVFTVIGAEFGKVEERTTIQEHLRQRQKMEAVGQLAAGVAHEINNPMSYVRSNLHHLREHWQELRSKLDGAAGASVLEDIDALIDESLEGVERTIHIVRGVREFSYMGAAGVRETTRVDLADPIGAALRVATSRLPSGVSVTAVHPDGGVRCTCVPDQIQQVLVNLLVNAIQAVGQQGEIVVTSGSDPDGVFVRVEDDGTGIPESARSRLFDPFYTTKPAGEGTGLGLAVSYEIVRGHGGDLRVESTPGAGATFEVRLPADPVGDSP